ncbi:DEAD/DEAH box helicase family protein [Leptolyngbya sp. FACHB-261]|uniref:DEAD/DEAH box helicase family protein n=1 Tax=Leptolyngbya sp. FACHB-261 TaxID=2692806 RepID=UPI0016866BE9|nr:DEAD/DEAH box helicase family protein [Leptolyngbya sp. FACHB-261]MBD2101776.1 DEAD/DEAH box helicase family protein [Leptolyngbya sp. FACHB-261]
MVYVSLNLDKLREQHINSSPKRPFQHQVEAFEALSKTFKANGDRSGSGILALPTGAGKTFTAVRWLSDHVVPKNIKILWLAPSFYLLDQAFSAFYDNAREIPNSKKTLNIRCISSNPSHAKASSIQLTDDVIIMTIQTAISNLHTDAIDRFGLPVQTAFRKFIESCKETELFIVVDEAHHTPAYGCRNLLIGEKDSALGLRRLLPKSHLLGLTATPTYTDASRRGWLWKIFQDGIIYKANKASLIAQKILARPNYIKAATGKELEVDDNLYKRLVEQHKDLPEDIIEILATDKDRNNFIANTYASNKDTYGKTIIFADRWFQCVYIKEKLLEKGIKVDAIYSHIDADPGSAEARNRRTQDDNKRILERFKTDKDEHGNDAPLDVLINVRMLTEGADVPTVKTVFITRQTTSSILITQMVGRALRGEKAGGSSEANIVLFFDDWKRLIDWGTPIDGGGTEVGPSPVRGYYPFEYISIRLVEEIAKSIESGGDYDISTFSRIFPVGWYRTEIVYADPDYKQESMEGFTEFVLAYEHNKQKLDAFIGFISGTDSLDEWSKEYLDNEWMQFQVEQWINKWFDRETDDIGERLSSDLIKIVRHIAQNQSIPTYHPFEERELYDLDKLAQKVVELSPRALREHLSQEFSKPGALWKTFYRSFSRFETAVQAAIRIILDRELCGEGISNSRTSLAQVVIPNRRELTEQEKAQIKRRDSCTCLCCEARGRGVRLEIDHIIPVFLGGETTLENSQTLCSVCNKEKGIHEINFRFNVTQLTSPKTINLSLPYKDQDRTRVITRIVNFFYHCKAVDQVDWHETVVEICLYAGNNPDWLLRHKAELLHFVQNQLWYYNVQDINVVVPN